jgi:hypothetical protein
VAQLKWLRSALLRMSVGLVTFKVTQALVASRMAAYTPAPSEKEKKRLWRSSGSSCRRTLSMMVPREKGLMARKKIIGRLCE